ncbi:carboxylate--amine ligase [Alkalibacillus aidingensis]|uniref:carboxylate--amine ligase n=1 Tax=Alkalibacillus aidingensis TaxID=2747607 RepID=UPI001660D280|nr:ATP-grasp domain-containing protein [Alkalibacillus aidingensis]
MNKENFIPVILGSDDNAYGMARAFHQEYGITSVVVTKGELLSTAHSQIVDKRIFENFDEPESFVQALLTLKDELKERSEHLILIASNENYVELAVRNRSELEPHFILPFVEEEMMDAIIFKENFYNLCEKYDLDYPDTLIFTKGMDPEQELPFGFPVVVKASDSMRYFNAQFPGKKKAYVIHSKEEFVQTIHNIYSSTYDGTLIIQDYIPGNDTVMRVLNAYCDRNGKVRMMCLGRVVLEDYTPVLIGNYVGIVGEQDQQLYDQYKTFLEELGFTGYANIDLKYDRRDGKYKIFELNIRQGRSSYFVTANGYNMAKYLVEDRVYQKDSEVDYGKNEVLWHSVPKKLLVNYTMDEDLKCQIKKLIRQKKTSTTLFYQKDFNLLRYAKLLRQYFSYYKRFKNHFKVKE